MYAQIWRVMIGAATFFQSGLEVNQQLKAMAHFHAFKSYSSPETLYGGGPDTSIHLDMRPSMCTVYKLVLYGSNPPSIILG